MADREGAQTMLKNLYFANQHNVPICCLRKQIRVALIIIMAVKIVCREITNATQSLSKETAELKPSAGSKRDTRSHRTEILRALGKSTTKSDVTEGFDHFCYLEMQLLLACIYLCMTAKPLPSVHRSYIGSLWMLFVFCLCP